MNLVRLFLHHPRYLVLAVSVAVATFSLITWFSQLTLLRDVAIGASLEDLGAVAAALLWGALIESGTTAFLLIAISSLFGLVVAASACYLRVYRASVVSSVTALSAGGSLSGILALGCLSCGSILAAFLSSFFSASSVLVFSAYQSALFGFLSIFLLLVSLGILNRRLADAARARL